MAFEPPPAELADPETPKPAPAAVVPPPPRQGGRTVRLPERRCLAFAKPEPAEDAGQNQESGPFVCSLPHGGEQGLASTRVETSYERVAEVAARLSPLQQRPRPSRPSHLSRLRRLRQMARPGTPRQARKPDQTQTAQTQPGKRRPAWDDWYRLWPRHASRACQECLALLADTERF